MEKQANEERIEFTGLKPPAFFEEKITISSGKTKRRTPLLSVLNRTAARKDAQIKGLEGNSGTQVS